MGRPKKFDYDSDDFYDEILALAMQGLTDAEIADALEDKLLWFALKFVYLHNNKHQQRLVMLMKIVVICFKIRIFA